MTCILLARMISKSLKNRSYPESWMGLRVLNLNSDVNIDIDFKEIVVTMRISYSYTKAGTSHERWKNDKML